MNTELPSWIDAYLADEREEASALQRLIAAFEPPLEPQRGEFRAALAAALQEAQKRSS